MSTPYPVTLPDAEWRQRLTPDQYRILRQAGTEAPWSGEYVETTAEGTYACRGCGAELFGSEAKFSAHCGWPSFFEAVQPDSIELIEDRGLGMVRTEVRCARCGGHLGHVFAGEGYPTPTDRRFCINSASIVLDPGAPSSGV